MSPLNLRLPPYVAIDRRKLLASAGALIAAGLLPRNVLAAMAPYSFKQGEADITVVSDGHLVLPSKLIAPDAPAQERQAVLEAIGITGDMVQPATNAVLMKAGNDFILFDTGGGGFQPTVGKLPANLLDAGIQPESVTKVVFTHAHPDHCWGTAPNGALAYPNAAYYAAAKEWDFWMNPALADKMSGMKEMVVNTQKHWGAIKDRVTMVKPAR
jgi:glyoxylase-like metal-dependent hydrolase (beta-lactamase superfamily II)